MNVICPDCSLERTVKFPLKNKKGVCLSCARKNVSGKRNPMYKEKASYIAIHVYVRRRKPCDGICQICSKNIGKKKLDLAKIHGRKYTREITDYIWLCRTCHNVYDYRVENIPKRELNIYKLHFKSGLVLRIQDLKNFCRLNRFNVSAIYGLASGRRKKYSPLLGAVLIKR